MPKDLKWTKGKAATFFAREQDRMDRFLPPDPPTEERLKREKQRRFAEATGALRPVRR